MRNAIRSLTLQEFCLQVVVENLEKFIYNQNVPQKHIDFLLRLYSEEVFRFFNCTQGVNEESMLWFLNMHCKNVTLPIISKKIIQQLQVIGPMITSLNLCNTLATETMLNSIICCIPNVTQLDMSNSFCCNETLLCVQKMCCSLITLNLHNCLQITDNGMKNLARSNLQLRNLNLIGTSVTYEGLSKILKRIPSLQCLKHHNMADSLYYIHKSDVKFNAKVNVCYNLTELIYHEGLCICKPIDVLQALTVMCPNVTKVHITITSTYEILKVCSKFQHLTDLEIKFDESQQHQLFSRNIDVLAPFVPQAGILTSLTLFDLEINTVTLLQCCKSVQTLCLQFITFNEFKETELEENKLKDLTIQGLFRKIPANYKAISALLSVSKSVTNLTLYPYDFPDNYFEILDVVLNSMKNLAFVDLRGFDYLCIDYHYLLRFYEIPSLKIIYLLDHSRWGLETDMRTYPVSTLKWQYCYFWDEFVIPGFQNFSQQPEIEVPRHHWRIIFPESQEFRDFRIPRWCFNLRNCAFRVFQFFRTCCRNICHQFNWQL